MANYSLWYAEGSYKQHEAIPSSAFSKGDILCYDSNSSLSRMPATFASGVKIAGVALSASTASINNKVAYILPNPDTVFWSEATIGLSNLTPGAPVWFSYVGSRWFAVNMGASSATTQCGVVDESGNLADISQSVQSRVKIRFISAFTNLIFS